MNRHLPRLILLLAALLLCQAAVTAQLIRNEAVEADVQQMLSKQKTLAPKRFQQVDSVSKIALTPGEKQALEYLYAYMPLSDLADYDADFFASQARQSLRAKNEMPWGRSIPEDIYLHFVLPPRVNNENPDLFRVEMYDELRQRTAGLGMRDAALEINHWCHEKVTYRSTDERTGSPLATVKTSFGRCGEESTLTVAALRTLAIPARQVYTPRWAHCDDNHAWVEVWIDGQWHFMGACEPEAELDMGWFAEPARRAMLVHTRAYGAYRGSEPVIDRQERFAELNVTSHYAGSRTVTIKVVDAAGNAVSGATVEYRIYNYAEFFPIATQQTNPGGYCSTGTGLGSLLIWAHKNNSQGFSFISVENTDTAVVKIDDKLPAGSLSLDFVPPVEKNPLPAKATAAQMAENNLRLLAEDSVRTSYMSTFRDSAWVRAFCESENLHFERINPLIQKSFGNWQEITAFIRRVPKVQKEWAIRLLEAVSEKDLRDTRADILMDHLENCRYDAAADNDSIFYARYVLNGRIANEMMRGWRRYLQQQFGIGFADSVRRNTGVLVRWISENIRIDTLANLHSRAPLSPAGVYALRVADRHSRDIFFVAACRSLGIAARLDAATGIPQYYYDAGWVNVDFESGSDNLLAKGAVRFVNASPDSDPQYAVNFTIARYREGVYRTVDFDFGKKLSEFGAATEVIAGDYMLVTGNRQPDGSVLTKVTFFAVGDTGVTRVLVEIRRDFRPVVPWAKIKTKHYTFSEFHSLKKLNLQRLCGSRGALLLWLDPGKEPSKHVLADLPSIRNLLEKWNGSVLLLLPGSESKPAFDPPQIDGMPANTQWAFDPGSRLLNQIGRLKKRDVSQNLPVIILCDSKGSLLYYSEGYRIGTGEQIAKALTPFIRK